MFMKQGAALELALCAPGPRAARQSCSPAAARPRWRLGTHTHKHTHKSSEQCWQMDEQQAPHGPIAFSLFGPFALIYPTFDTQQRATPACGATYGSRSWRPNHHAVLARHRRAVSDATLHADASLRSCPPQFQRCSVALLFAGAAHVDHKAAFIRRHQYPRQPGLPPPFLLPLTRNAAKQHSSMRVSSSRGSPSQHCRLSRLAPQLHRVVRPVPLKHSSRANKAQPQLSRPQCSQVATESPSPLQMLARGEQRQPPRSCWYSRPQPHPCKQQAAGSACTARGTRRPWASRVHHRRRHCGAAANGSAPGHQAPRDEPKMRSSFITLPGHDPPTPPLTPA
jgi:hypothetical protein